MRKRTSWRLENGKLIVLPNDRSLRTFFMSNGAYLSSGHARRAANALMDMTKEELIVHCQMKRYPDVSKWSKVELVFSVLIEDDKRFRPDNPFVRFFEVQEMPEFMTVLWRDS